MSKGVFDSGIKAFNILLAVGLWLLTGCHGTRYLKEDLYLVRKSKVILNSEKVITNRGEIKDNLIRIGIQKPNSYSFGIFPIKLSLYNRRYKKLSKLPDSMLSKNVERPVIFDSSLMFRSSQNMKSYLFNQGYFYARVEDTVVFRKKKAYITYKVFAGSNYLINRVNYDFDDSAIAAVIRKGASGTVLKKGTEFTYSLLEEERSRIAAVVANNGYRRFSQENITFKIDTIDKALFRVVASPFENAVNFISQTKSNRKTTIDIDVIIRMADDTLAYNTYVIGKVVVYPDYAGADDRTDTNMIRKRIGNVDFKYHNDYVNANVLYEHIFLTPGHVYSKSEEDKTNTKLNELGIFQYIRVQLRENRVTRDTLDCSIFLNRTKKHDFSTNYEVSSGSTYALGNALGMNYRNRNFMRGANLLTIGVNGGVELFYNENMGDNVVSHFDVLTRYYGANASIDFPKFLAPIAASLFDNSNLPHTIVSGGENVIDRVSYFTLVNSSANFSYSWHQTQTKTWSLSPAFINIIRLPRTTDSFQRLLDVNEYLRNSYKPYFIEGENVTFKYDNYARKRGVNYSYLRLALEEAGIVSGVINTLGDVIKSKYELKYIAQYTKFDFDARHYFTRPRSVFAFRFYGGVGIPYGTSETLPYIKQYYAGGPYGLRGWKIRTLGPGSYLDTNLNAAKQVNQIDRTGDVKMELNGEYRFPITPLFAGAIKMNGAIFADAGNIWLAKKNANYPGGEIELSALGQDIAMDMGMGSRFDIASFLTFRVDVAMPVKKPYILSNNGWVFKDLDFYNSTWRANNVIVNVSIGYPF